MQRLVSLKLLSKIPRNPTKTNLSVPSINPSPHHPHHFFTHYTTFSHSRNGLFSQQRLVSHGFFSNPILSKHFWSHTLVKGQSNGVLGRSFGSAKDLFLSKMSYKSYGRDWRSTFQRLSSDKVVLGLILSNVAIFMLWRVAGHSFMMKNFTISVDNFKNGRVHTLITSAFSHMDMGHLISNMIGLYFFGTSIGRTFGSEYFLKLYLSGAVVGSVFFLAYHAFVAPSMKGNGPWGIDFSKISGYGANGAVNAVMLLDIFLFPSKTIYLNLIIPVPAILLGIYLIGSDTLRILEGDTKISGSSHLGGAAVAAIAWARMRRGYY